MDERLRRKSPDGYNSMTKREFLKGCLLTILALMLQSCRNSDKDDAAEQFLTTTDNHGGKYNSSDRQANTEAVATLRTVLKLMGKHYKGHIFDLGDKIADTADEEENIRNMQDVLEPYSGLDSTQLVGNHDIWGIRRAKIEETFKNAGVNEQLFGVKAYRDYQAVWIDLVSRVPNEEYLPEERIEWLTKVIYPDTPTIIYTHKSLEQLKIDDSDYFKGRELASRLTNGPDVWKRIKHLPIKAVISGHLHPVKGFVYKQEEGTIHIALPSLVEKIDGKNPGTITIFEAGKKELRFQAISRGKVIYDLRI